MSLFSLLESVKTHFLKQLMGYFSYPHSALLYSMVFGGSSTLSAEIQHSFKVIGMQHVTSASGFNVSLMLGMTVGVSHRFRRLQELLILYGVIVIYALLAEATPSILRASSMAMCSLTAQRFLLRQSRADFNLAWCTMALACLSWETVSSLSYQLSLAASLGIIWFTPHWMRFNPGDTLNWTLTAAAGLPTSGPELNLNSGFGQVKELLQSAFFTTLAAQIFTVPLILHAFGELSTLSLVSNTLLLWITPLLTQAAIGFGIGAALLSYTRQLHILLWMVTPLIWGLLTVFLTGVTWLSQWETSLLEVKWFASSHLLLWYACAVALHAYLRRRTWPHRQQLEIFHA